MKMTVTLYAQPYDISAYGFYFKSYEDYLSAAAKSQNAYGHPVEEFEIQFIDGTDLDSAFAEAFGPHQGNLRRYFEAVGAWDDDEKVAFIIAVGECGYSFDPMRDAPSDFDVEIYKVQSLTELAEQFVEDGMFVDIPEQLRPYIDTDLIARDLAFDYAETTIAGEAYVYRCL